MKTIKLSLLALVALGSLSYAGGDMMTVTPYETEDVMMAEEVIETPVIVQEAIVEPAPAPAVVNDVHPSGFYAGLGIAATQYKTNCEPTCIGSGTDKAVGVMARAGYDFNPYIGVEVRGLRSAWKENGSTVKHAGVFVKPMLPVTNETNVYGLVGMAKTTTSGTLQETNAEALALGAGVEVDLSEDTPKEGRYGRTFDGKGDQEKGVGLFVDYERMVVKSGAPDLDALSAGVTYDF